MTVNELSAISEIAVSYALLTVGTDTNESKIMRLRCADAARELGATVTANEIEKSLAGAGTTLAEAVEIQFGAVVSPGPRLFLLIVAAALLDALAGWRERRAR